MKKSTLLILVIIAAIIAFMIIIAAFIYFSKTQEKGFIQDSGALEVYFCPIEMCNEKLIVLVNSSSDIRCAFYDLDLPELASLLMERRADVVLEDSNRLEGFYSGYSAALMHNKFCVFDRETVFTGSMNPTENDNYKNNNNIVIIRSRLIAQNYLDEYEELRAGKHAGGEPVQYPRVNVSGIGLENYFCPEDNCKLAVLRALSSANSTIYFMTFSFTDEDIANLLWNKAQAGLTVRGIFEEKQLSEFSRYDELRMLSIIDRNKYTMHHKVFIIDNRTVITGSFNPSSNANTRNDENVLIIHDMALAEKYAGEFNRLFHYEERLPAMVRDLVIQKVIYDAPGSDEGNEEVVIKNVGSQDINLDYYQISDNKTNSRLGGMLKSGEALSITPKYSLKNSEGILLLKHNDEIIDYVMWEGSWPLSAKEGQALYRKEINIGMQAWTVT